MRKFQTFDVISMCTLILISKRTSFEFAMLNLINWFNQLAADKCNIITQCIDPRTYNQINLQLILSALFVQRIPQQLPQDTFSSSKVCGATNGFKLQSPVEIVGEFVGICHWRLTLTETSCSCPYSTCSILWHAL